MTKREKIWKLRHEQKLSLNEIIKKTGLKKSTVYYYISSDAKGKQLDRQTKRRKELKEFIESFKTKCSKCDESDIACLDFHHLDSNQKDFDVALAISNKQKNSVVIEEIKKCIVLCSNCHRKLHRDIRRGIA